MACPDLYPPTPQDTPHGTPETTPHLSLHRRTLLNQHMGSLTGLAPSTPQLHHESGIPTVTNDEWDEVPEYPPPPYPGLANGDVSMTITEDSTDVEVENGPDTSPGIVNPVVSQPESDNFRALSPVQNSSSPVGEQENPWILNDRGNSSLRNRSTAEQFALQSGALSDDSIRTNSQEEVLSGSNTSDVADTADERIPKAGIGQDYQEPQNPTHPVAVA